jgi:hypothetical protein
MFEWFDSFPRVTQSYSQQADFLVAFEESIDYPVATPVPSLPPQQPVSIISTDSDSSQYPSSPPTATAASTHHLYRQQPVHIISTYSSQSPSSPSTTASPDHLHHQQRYTYLHRPTAAAQQRFCW